MSKAAGRPYAPLIEQECKIKLGVRTVGKYLKRRGFTPQKPINKANEQRPEAVQAWLEEKYPAIEAQAKAEGGEIHWGDETALVNTDKVIEFLESWVKDAKKKSVLDIGQPAGASQQACEGLVDTAHRADRGVLPAQLQP